MSKCGLYQTGLSRIHPVGAQLAIQISNFSDIFSKRRFFFGAAFFLAALKTGGRPGLTASATPMPTHAIPFRTGYGSYRSLNTGFPFHLFNLKYLYL